MKRWMYLLATGLCITASAAVLSIKAERHRIGEVLGYFNKKIEKKYADNSGENDLQKELIKLINKAQQSIELCVYEINLPEVVDALINSAKRGVRVRVIVDGKDGGEGYRNKRYALMRLYIEKLIRGGDSIIGTKDDVKVFGDSPLFAVDDSRIRRMYSLPEQIEDMTFKSIGIGRVEKSGYLMVEGERCEDGRYISPQNQMHNKFMVVDSKILWTGSWNMTVTGLYGDYHDAVDGRLNGNQQHCVRVENSEVAQVYQGQFNEMWGGEGMEPDPYKANFSGRKNRRNHYRIAGEKVNYEIFFTPSREVISRIRKLISHEDNKRSGFALFCISHDGLMEDIMEKSRTGDVTMVIDEGMWKQKWSSVRKMCDSREFFPFYEDSLEGKLHAKSGVLNPFGEGSVVITGSMNWTKNGEGNNDENVIIIYGDEGIAKEFYGEIISRAEESIR